MAGKTGMQRKSQFGTVRKLPSGMWQGTYLTPDGARTSVGTFRRKDACRDRLNQVAEALRTGTWIDPLQSARTVADVANLWLESDLTKRPNTLATDRNDVETHIVPALGHMTLADVSPMTIERTIKAWTLGTGPRRDGARSIHGKPSPRTVRRRYATLQAIFNYAEDHRWLVPSPCPTGKQAHLPKVTQRTLTRRYDLTDEDVFAIAGAIRAEYRAMVFVGALAGLRWSEVAALRVGDVDLLAGTLMVDGAIIRGGKGVGPIEADPKSAMSLRPLPIRAEVVDLLAQVMNDRELVDDDGLLFPGTSGAEADDRWFRSRVWYPALKAVGLFDAKPFRPGFHDLRRYFGETGRAQGVDLKTMQRLFGHADIRTTAGSYIRGNDAGDRAAVMTMGDGLIPQGGLVH